jgi:hypothetical protein
MVKLTARQKMSLCYQSFSGTGVALVSVKAGQRRFQASQLYVIIGW